MRGLQRTPDARPRQIPQTRRCQHQQHRGRKKEESKIDLAQPPTAVPQQTAQKRRRCQCHLALTAAIMSAMTVLGRFHRELIRHNEDANDIEPAINPLGMISVAKRETVLGTGSG